MRAMIADRYGENDVLHMAEIDDPRVGPDNVLIRTKAISVNPVDWKIVRGRLDRAFPTHFPLIPCWDVAGEVVAVGPAVTDLRAGDDVLAYNRRDHVQFGTAAELVSAPFRAVARKPAGLGWNEAAAIPLAGLTAWQTIINALAVQEGDTVLVQAAAGGVGSFAVQLAAMRGARVIGTASERNHEYVRALGAEPVPYGDGLVDALQAIAPDGFDAILDLVGGEVLERTAELRNDGGRLASIVDPDAVRRLGGVYVFVHADAQQLAQLAELVASGALRVEIAATYPLKRLADAFDELESNHVRGKLVVTAD